MQRIQTFLRKASDRLAGCATWIFIAIVGVPLFLLGASAIFDAPWTIPHGIVKIAVPVALLGIALSLSLAAICKLFNLTIILARLFLRLLWWTINRFRSVKGAVGVLIVALVTLLTVLLAWKLLSQPPPLAVLPAPQTVQKEPEGKGAAAPLSTKDNFCALAKSLFPKIDSTRKGFITPRDIDLAILLDHSIKGDKAAALVTLRSAFEHLASKKGQLTLEDLDTYQLSAPAFLPDLQIEWSMNRSTSFLPTVNRGLYPVGPQSLTQVISQANRGNCYFESGIGSLASVDPEKLKSAITDTGVNAAGVHVYTVRFPRAPGETYRVEELTDAALLLNDVEQDSGTWLSVLVRAYGMYNQRHPTLRWPQRWWHGLNSRVLPEEVTDQGALFHDGLRMFTPPDTSVEHVVWSLDTSTVRDFLNENLLRWQEELAGSLTDAHNHFDGRVPNLAGLAKSIDKRTIEVISQDVADDIQSILQLAIFSPREAAVVHQRLEKSICKQHLPATVFRLKGGALHEAGIIAYTPGTKSPDGKHTSAYGFITVRDQAGLDGVDQQKIAAGIWWRDPGMDDQTAVMSVEEFTAHYSGFAYVVRY